MTLVSRRPPAPQVETEAVELVVAPAAIARALQLYEQRQPHDTSVILQARKILTQHIFGMVDKGELDEERLTVAGLRRLKAVERDHPIKSAHGSHRKGAGASRGCTMESIPILTAGDLKSELSRWSDATPVTFYSPLKEQ